MSEPKLVEAMEYLDEELISGAVSFTPKKKKIVAVGWAAAAACLCAAILGLFSLWSADSGRLPGQELQPLRIPELSDGSMGFEGYLYHDPSEISNGNPWREGMELSALPVYENRAYDPSGAGLPRGLTEPELRAVLDTAAASLGAEILSTELLTNEGEQGEPIPSELRAKTDLGTVSVQADGGIAYFLPEERAALPDGCPAANDGASEDAAKETISYLCEVYKTFLNMEEPEPVSWGDYDIYEAYNRRYEAFDAAGNDLEDLVRYNLCRASFFLEADGRLSGIRLHNGLMLAEKIGDYPILSAQEAEQRLLAGNYQTSAPFAMPGKEAIVKVELIYRAGRLEELLLPYYRFYVRLDMERFDNDLQLYAAYYVPAITEEYVAHMPVYDGRSH